MGLRHFIDSWMLTETKCYINAPRINWLYNVTYYKHRMVFRVKNGFCAFYAFLRPFQSSIFDVNAFLGEVFIN
jgi:hypothetical protein